MKMNNSFLASSCRLFHAGGYLYGSQSVSKIRKVCLVILVQMLCQEKKSYVIEVKGKDIFGTICLADGEIYSATVPGSLEGRDALLQMLIFDQVDATVWAVDFSTQLKKNIAEPAATLLTEAVRKTNSQTIADAALIRKAREQIRSAQIIDQNVLQAQLENIQTKITRYCKHEKKTGKIINAMITDSSGNLLLVSNPAADISENLTHLIAAALEMINLSLIIYDICPVDHICQLDSRYSILLSPVGTEQFLVVIFDA